MKEKRQITAFYLETLLIMVVFVSITMVLTRVFGSASVRSMQAESLTNAVTLAQNTAEAVSAARDPQDLCTLLDEDRNAVLEEKDESGAFRILACYDSRMKPVRLLEDGEAKTPFSGHADSDLIVEAVWEQTEDPSDDGALAHVTISVYKGTAGKAVYSLETAVFTEN